MNYLVVLFKNKKRKKIIKSFVRKNIAERFYNSKLDESNKVKFEVTVENSEPVTYELGIVSTVPNIQIDLFIQDDIGRNIKVNLDDDKFKILTISNYNITEKIQDWTSNERITYDSFFEKYFSTKELKNVFTIHNKLFIQRDENINVFSLKNSNESKRLLNVLQQHLIDDKRSDAIFVPDRDTIQRKYLYNLLEEKGFNKNRLYRQSTTFSKRK
jgi:arsenate reductase-like glutaredoxin family protein